MFRARLGCILLGLLVSQVLLGQAVTSSTPSSPDLVSKQVTDWFRNSAIPLKSTSPESGLNDLLPLQRVIGDAQIVAMGEETHGTHEFFQLKRRMVEFLVEKMGFTVFGIEANWPESLAVNDYVLNGTGDPADALSGMYFRTWDTQELLDLIRWMRRYNQDSAHTKKLEFIGFDMQTARVAVSNVEHYLQKVDPEEAKVASKVLLPLADAAGEKVYSKKTVALRHETAAAIKVLLQEFEKRKTSYIKASSEEEWILAQHNLEIVSQAERVHSLGAALGRMHVRDLYMAENVRWILNNQPPGTKMMIWAHNGHVATQGMLVAPPMGMYLRRMYGSRLVVCGFSFNQGSFQATDRDWKLHEFTVGPAPPDTLDAVLAATGLPLFAVDLRAAPNGLVGNWLDSPQRMRSIGVQYSDAFPQMFYVNVQPRSFDVIFFVNQTTGAHENPKPPEIEFHHGQ